ncbi:MAG: hypothetical protein FWD25_10255 [Clostridia bacterium]|nr:hypothetical protein [Clostridia bacterium]
MLDEPIIQALITEVSGAKRYRHIDAAIVEQVCREEAQKRNKPKEAAKAAKRRLHQMTGAYCDKHIALSFAPDEMAALCAAHASTKERLPFAGEMFADIRQQVGGMERVADLACGVNPVLYVAECLRANLPLPRFYAAYDIRHDVLEQVRACFDHFGMDGTTGVCDLLTDCPDVAADVTLLFKIVPLLERQQKGRFEQVIAQANSPFVAVTFPTRSLGGKNVGMAPQYRRFFAAYLQRAGHRLVFEKEYPNELLFLIEKEEA